MLDFLPGVTAVTEPADAQWESIPATERAAGSSAAKPRLIFKRNESALQPERLTRATQVAQWLFMFEADIAPLLKAGKIRTAITDLWMEAGATCIAHREMIDRLDDRIAALEAERAAAK